VCIGATLGQFLLDGHFHQHGRIPGIQLKEQVFFDVIIKFYIFISKFDINESNQRDTRHKGHQTNLVITKNGKEL
jgi:hypothetical protein